MDFLQILRLNAILFGTDIGVPDLEKLRQNIDFNLSRIVLHISNYFIRAVYIGNIGLYHTHGLAFTNTDTHFVNSLTKM